MTLQPRGPRPVPPSNGIPPVPRWSPTDFIVYRNELAAHVPDINAALRRGLQELLVNTDWYLTGMKVSLESVNAFCDISEIVYRNFTARTEGGWHLSHLKKVTRKMEEFARDDQTASTRARIMLDIRPSLAIVLRAFEGSAAGGQKGRKTMLAQLASDISFFRLRARSLRKVEASLSEIRAARNLFFKTKRQELIEAFHRGHLALAPLLGYSEPAELLDNKVVAAAQSQVKLEQKKMELKMRQVRDAIYSRSISQYPSDDPEEDLAEANIITILTKISAAGFEFLDRAGNLYEHALTKNRNRNGIIWLRHLSQLESRLYEHELLKFQSRKAL